jgi:hypothetical protein
VPGAASGLADVGAADPDPLVLDGCGDHAPQQLSVGGLDPVPLGQRRSRLGDAVRERVAHALQLAEPEHAGGSAGSPHGGVDLDPPETLGDELGELALEAADLPAQLAASERLIDRSAGKVASVDQLPHRAS